MGARPEKELIPANEPERLAAVRRYDILDTPPDGAFDRITAIAARLFNVPIAIISIVDHDRIWFKSHHGIDATEIGRDPGLCASAILRDEPRILPDAKRDVHALANPLVAGEFGLRFYLGVPLRTPDGFNLGTLCVIDRQPREASPDKIADLEDLASLVMDQLELRRSARAALAAKDALVEGLAASEERQRALIASSPLAIVVIDPDARVRLWNAAAEQLFGWTAADVLGRIVPFIPAGRQPECVACRATTMHGDVFAIQTQRLRRDGSLVEVSLIAAPLRQAGGEIAEILVLFEDITERKRAEEALRRSEERLRAMFNSAAVGAAILTPAAQFIQANRAFCSITGYAAEELRSLDCTALTHPDDRAHMQELVDELLAGRTPSFMIEKRYLRKDGALIWVQNSISLTRDAAGQPLHLIALCQDITDRKRAVEALRESRAALEFALESAQVGDWDLDLIHDTSRRSLRHDQCFGYAEPIAKWGFEEFIRHVHPEDRARIERQFREAVSELKDWHFECRVAWPDGSVHWIAAHGSIYRTVEGRPTRMLGIVADITERKSAEEALRESDAYLRMVLDSASDGFYSVDRGGATTLCNAAFLRMLGFAREADAIGKALHDVIHHSHPDGRHYPKEDCPIYRTARTGQPAHVENELFFRRDGTSFPVEYWARPIYHDGELQGAVCNFIDITERRRAQDRQDLLLREMSHRIKNLFAVTGSVVALSARSALTPQDMAKAIRGRLEALARAHALIMPALTGAEETIRQEATLSTLVQAICLPYLDHEGSERIIVRGPSVPIGGHAVTSLALVLHELATNAAKYGALSSPGGRLEIAWSLKDGGLELTWAERGGPALDGSPEGEGFGSLLARRSVEGQLGGRLSHDWTSEGLTVRLSAPAERLIL